MNKKTLFSLVLAAFMLIPTTGAFIQGMNQKSHFSEEKSYVLKTLTVYNPTHKQCDNTPFITASNAKIDTLKLRNQKLRWMALSRNLLKRWKGVFSYGDTVRLYTGDPDIDGLWIIQDNLNKRYRDRGDLLFDRTIRTYGRWKNAKIYKV